MLNCTQMTDITLSYIITTRNKLSSLQRVIEKLHSNKLPNEEIIIADGASTDGTKEYLEKLLQDGVIDILISEPDKGEAHGFNKCMMRARGIVIKVLTDDDDFHYPSIKKCARFMIEHPEIDLLATNGGKKPFDLTSQVGKFSYEGDYTRWLHKKTPFSFCGLGLMIRKDSIPIIGLFSTNFIRVDAEFALRVSSSKANIAWYTGVSFVHIANPRGNTITMHHRIAEETIKLDYLYFDKKPSLFNLLRKDIINVVKKSAIINNKDLLTPQPQDSAFLKKIFSTCDQWLATTEQESLGKFLFK